MFTYIYYGYIAYRIYDYSYILSYGYSAVKFISNIFVKDSRKTEIDKDWVLCR